MGKLKEEEIMCKVISVVTIGWRDCQNHKRYEINHSENSNHADETGGQKSRNGANQEESQKFHYRAVEPKKERNGRA